MILEIRIPIIPKTVQSEARSRILYNPVRLHYYNDPEKVAYYDAIYKEVEHQRPAHPLSGPLAVHWKFYLPRPKSLTDPGAVLVSMERGPDLSNLLKGAEDALTKAGVWKDDGLICKSSQEKYYHEEYLFPRIEVQIHYDEKYQRKHSGSTAEDDPGPRSGQASPNRKAGKQRPAGHGQG